MNEVHQEKEIEIPEPFSFEESFTAFANSILLRISSPPMPRSWPLASP